MWQGKSPVPMVDFRAKCMCILISNRHAFCAEKTTLPHATYFVDFAIGDAENSTVGTGSCAITVDVCSISADNASCCDLI